MGVSLTAISKNGNWIKVKTQSGIIGYISKMGVKISTQEWQLLLDEVTGKYDQIAIYKFNKETKRRKSTARIRYSLNMFESPSAKSEAMELLKKGAVVKLLNKEGSWVRVKSPSNKIGYVSKNWINISNENFELLPTETQCSEAKKYIEKTGLVGNYGYLSDEGEREMPLYVSDEKFGTWVGSIKEDVPFVILKKQEFANEYVYIETFEDKAKVKGWIQIEYLDINPEAQIEFGKLSKSIKNAKQKEMQELLETLKKIPASDYKQNIKYYEQLVALDPDDRRYKEKLKYYENKLRQRNQNIQAEKRKKRNEKYRKKIASKIAEGYSLEIRNWTWGHEHGYAIATGQIRNITNRRLVNVAAVVTWYNNSGQFIASDSSLIEYQVLMPGQLSPFKVMEGWNPQMKRATLEFKTLSGVKLGAFK